MDEIEPGDCWGTTDPLDAVNVDLVVRGEKRIVNDVKGITYKLGRHETLIANKDLVQRQVGFDKGHGIFIGKIKVEDVCDSELDEFRDMSRQ